MPVVRNRFGQLPQAQADQPTAIIGRCRLWRQTDGLVASGQRPIELLAGASLGPAKAAPVSGLLRRQLHGFTKLADGLRKVAHIAESLTIAGPKLVVRSPE